MLKVRYNGQQKLATFFATLLQNELNTVGMLRFIPPTFKPALQQNQVVAGCEKLSQKVESHRPKANLSYRK